MADPRPVDSPTVRAHKRQFVWRILLPMILVVLLGLAAGALVIAASVSGKGQSRLWADVSIIWLIAPLLILALTFFAVLCFLIWGLARLLKITPRFTGRVQFYAAAAAVVTRRLADGAIQPVLWLRQTGAAIRSFFDKR